MRSALLVFLGLVLQQDGPVNPLMPAYPFKTARITYKKAGDVQMTALVRGSNVILRSKRMNGAKVAQEILSWTDGDTIVTVTWVDGVVKSATRFPHPGSYVAAHYKAMTDEQRKAFGGKVESFWNRYSPIFWHDIVRTPAAVKETKTESVAGKECVLLDWPSASETRVWRWKGTDIILKREKGKAVTLEAEKIEVDIEIDGMEFGLPGVEFKPDSSDAVFDEKRALELFKDLGGIIPEKK